MKKLSDYQKKKFAQMWAKDILTDDTIVDAFNESENINDHLIIDGDLSVMFSGFATYNQFFNHGEDERDPMHGYYKEIAYYNIEGTISWDEGVNELTFSKEYCKDLYIC